MTKGERLRKGAEFAAVYERGRTWVSYILVLKALSNKLGYNRAGFVTSKALGNAVVRNRVRRLLRESVRLTSLRPGWDLVFIARKGAAAARYQEIKAAVEGLLQRARLLS